ncbi:hypothetical protein WJX72_010373 [[Myrmecia] bisecta]|uniref:RING-type E3 ubiquitin transferase n=1 Tax=[Myrmecia] bisecta TaxID=41462 RepID=A0AAW1QAU9_9CHLO
MGHKSRQKDRGYQTKTEWATEGGGYKDKSKAKFKPLPFFCCAISFTPFDDPVCTADGTVYDITNIVPYIQKFKRHPVSGEPLQLRDLIKLHFHKNADNEFHCPVLNKVFTEHTHIVAVKTSGNVYSWEAVEELNIKPKFYKDLLSDEPFTRKDIIQIQDPLNLANRTLDNFDHVKKDLRVVDDEELARQQADPMYSLKSLSEDQKRVLSKLNTQDAAQAFASGGGGKKAEAHRILAEAKAAAQQAEVKTKRDGPDPRLQPPERQEKEASSLFKPGASTWNTDDPKQAHHPPAHRKKNKHQAKAAAEPAAPAEPAADKRPVPKPYMMDAKFVTDEFHTTGAASRSFTSTAVQLVTTNERQQIRVERNPKKKAYLRLHTNLGDLNLELHCDMVPRTCENFLVLAESGYYSDTIFHRSLKNFMIQGGDPTGTGTGGESIYGPTFRDELDSRLLHSGRGVLSMANSGPHTNGSQFFILYKSAHHLDYKHSVFGRVVGGFDVLTKMENVPTNEDDRPLEPIRMTGVTIFVNPYKEEEAEELKKAEEDRKAAEKAAAPPGADENVGSWFSNPSFDHGTLPVRSGVGKYIAAATLKAPKAAAPAVPAAAPAPKKQKTATQGFGNFDGW